MAKSLKMDKEYNTKQNKYLYSLGRRKTAVAKVKLFPNGSGKFSVNGKDYRDFFPQFTWSENLELPLAVVGAKDKFDVVIETSGGGKNSSSEACRLGIARALVKVSEDNKKPLRAAGYLTRDPRAKERKKPGLKRARRAPQWSKR